MQRIVYMNLDRGFLSIHAFEMINAMVREGARVTLIHLSGVQGIDELDAKVERIQLDSVPGRYGQFWLPFRVLRPLRHGVSGAQHIYVRQNIYHFLLPILLRLSGYDYWAEFNQCSGVGKRHGGLRRMFVRFMEAACLRFSTRIVVPSAALGRVFVDTYPSLRGAIEKKLKILPNAANIDIFTPGDKSVLRRELGIEPERTWIGFVGSLLPWQGVDLFIEAMDRVHKRGKSVRGLVVGGYDIYGEMSTQQRLESLASFHEIHFTGRVNYRESARWMSACDILVAPYTSEYRNFGGGAPMKVYAYLASGRPVVVSAIDGWTEHEWIMEQGAGISIAMDSVDALVDAVEAMLADPAAMQAMGLQARHLAVQGHDWKHRAIQLLQWMGRER